MLEEIFSFVLEVVSGLGYPGIVLIMFLESSFFPFPSEAVMIPAGYLAATGRMDLALVIACGVLGSVLGAAFNYYIALKFGRKAVLKIGHYFFLDEQGLAGAERKFNEHGAIITFVGRLLPGVRQYISFPPGLSRMDLKTFIVYTALGSGVWVTVLALMGFFFGENRALVKQHLNEATLLIIAFCALLVLGYWLWKKKKS
jgi:membrane protein DedA with SNARE-associated domain